VILTVAQRDELIAHYSRAWNANGVPSVLRCPATVADAQPRIVRGSDGDDLLERAVRRERVAIEMDLLAYEQGQPDSDGDPIPNRNHVRFRDGIMMRLGRTGKGAPFLRDHRQSDSEARGGTVIESTTEKLADGHYRIRQTVQLVEPSAVERALRGLMSGVSIGWRPTGAVHCTLCRTDVLTDGCTHFPGDVDDGATAEWEFQDAELIETSEVAVPGVQSAHVEEIRAAFRAAHAAHAAQPRGTSPQETTAMSKLVGIATALNLAATAGEDEIHKAVGDVVAERDVLKAQLAAEQKRTAEINARLQTHEAALAKQAEDVWIEAGIKAGKVTLGAHENALRAYFRSNPDGARLMLDAAPVITPVGQPSQVAPSSAPSADAATRTALATTGVNVEKARHFAKLFGASDPDKALAAYAQRVQEG
jgi:hypothetical protein